MNGRTDIPEMGCRLGYFRRPGDLRLATMLWMWVVFVWSVYYTFRVTDILNKGEDKEV